MSESRKTSGAREKDLRLAMFRIQQGRAHTKATSLTIASVAREAGVSAALIHNHYPTIADAIRNAQGRDNRAQRVAKNLELLEERKKLRELRGENASLRDEVAKLASINEVLMNENDTLRVALNNPKVVDFGSKKRKK